jgi:hypothetical protein
VAEWGSGGPNRSLNYLHPKPRCIACCSAFSNACLARWLKRSCRTGTSKKRCRYSPHSLRATTATLLDEAGVPIKRIQELLGHKDIRVTQAYINCYATQGRARHMRCHCNASSQLRHSGMCGRNTFSKSILYASTTREPRRQASDLRSVAPNCGQTRTRQASCDSDPTFSEIAFSGEIPSHC